MAFLRVNINLLSTNAALLPTNINIFSELKCEVIPTHPANKHFRNTLGQIGLLEIFNPHPYKCTPKALVTFYDLQFMIAVEERRAMRIPLRAGVAGRCEAFYFASALLLFAPNGKRCLSLTAVCEFF